MIDLRNGFIYLYSIFAFEATLECAFSFRSYFSSIL